MKTRGRIATILAATAVGIALSLGAIVPASAATATATTVNEAIRIADGRCASTYSFDEAEALSANGKTYGWLITNSKVNGSGDDPFDRNGCSVFVHKRGVLAKSHKVKVTIGKKSVKVSRVSGTVTLKAKLPYKDTIPTTAEVFTKGKNPKAGTSYHNHD